MVNLIIIWVLYAFAIMFTAWIIPGIDVEGFFGAMIVAVVLGAINMFIKPILKIVTLPINILTLGLFGLVLNALLLMLAGYVTPWFEVEGFWSAVFGSILISLLGIGIQRIGKEED